MKHLLNILLFIGPFLLQAQNPIQVQVGTQSGYEYNVFNANPNRQVISAEGDTLSALQSGFFQQLSIESKWRKKIKANQFDIKFRTRYDYLPTLQSANLLRPELSLGYTRKIKKKASIYWKGRYVGFQTNRIPDDTEVLAVPVGYRRLQTDIGWKFRLHKQNRSRIQSSLLEKRYTPGEDSGLKYVAVRLDLQSKQRIKKEGKASSYLILDADIQRRHYIRTFMEFFDEEEEDLDEEDFDPDFSEEVRELERIWQYHTLSLAYQYDYAKSFSISSGVSFQQRLDRLDDQFGYLQWLSFVKISVEKGPLELAWKIEGIHRAFTHLGAIKGENELLRHQYLRTSVSLLYAISERCTLSLNANLRKRWRNRAERATTFLPYTNGMISLGIKYRF